MRVAIITGAGSGIGLGVAEKLAAAGMAVVGVGRDAAKLADLSNIVPAERLAVVSADLTADDAPARVVAEAVARWGRIDVLINNAGVGKPKAVHDTDDATLDYVLSLNLRAPFRMIREALPHMGAGSSIVNISSTYAIVGGTNGGAYSAAKSGLIGLTMHMALQYGPRGIRSNVVAPGVVRTDMTEHVFDNDIFKKMNVHMTPYPRLATVEDVASVIAFLCSPGSELINGQTLVVDGGWSSTKYLSDFGRSSKWTPADE
jgi:meso-butanediol dehydrogenase/(S,S)-butanediol dehydrogenase/diacetyl reductase